MKKKITVVFVIILILFNFIVKMSYAEENTTTGPAENSSNTSTAGTTGTTTTPTLESISNVQDGSGTVTSLKDSSKGTLKDLISGQSSVTGTAPGSTTTTTAKSITKNFQMQKIVNSSSPSVFQTLSAIWAFAIGGWLNNIPQYVVESTGCEVKNGVFTIYDLVTGEYEVFNLNFADIDKLNAKVEKNLVDKITITALGAYLMIRRLALAISLFVLIYIAIRMVVSTTSDKKALYSKMLTAWFTSLVLIFFMHYIIIIMGYCLQFLLDLAKRIGETWGVNNIEAGILTGQYTTLQNGSQGFHLLQVLILVTVFVYYEIKFLIAYIKRYCEMLFLIMISPLVTVTYSIDKAGDGRAQAYTNWFKELSSRYVIQVVHAIMYIILLASAGAIAQNVPIIAALFLWSMGKAESIVRKVAGIKGMDHVQKSKVPKPPGIPHFLKGRMRPH